MNSETCRFESRVIEAARSGLWSDELHSHLADCVACEETRTVAGFMNSALSGVAATLTAWASIEWILPVIMMHADVFAMGGAAIALTLGVLYVAVYRPLRHDRR